MVMLGLILIGSVWGTTNAFIKRGAHVAQKKERERKEKKASSSESSSDSPWLLSFVLEWFHLLCVWEYSIPFLINLSASVLFVRALGDSPINVAVPVTNATTFAVTALAGAALGENVEVWKALVGVCVIVLGIVFCIVPGII